MEILTTVKFGIFLLMVLSYVNGQSSPPTTRNHMNNNNDDDEDNKQNRLATVAVVLAVISITILIVISVIYCCKKCKKSKQTHSANSIPTGYANGQPGYIRQDMNQGQTNISMPPPTYSTASYTAGPQANGGMVSIGPLPGESSKGGEDNHAYQ